MPIPKEILAVKRPTNTRVKLNGKHYDVIKRTCKYVNGKRIPVELGKIGEIINFQYIEMKSKRLSLSDCDIRDFGRTEVCVNSSQNLFKELCESFSIDDASAIYVMAVLRAAYGNTTDRDMKYRYDTSYLSEQYQSVALSEKSICGFLELLGRNVGRLVEYMKQRIARLDKHFLSIIDGMLKDCSCDTSSFTDWSRKSRLKGSEDISLLYCFDSLSGEPIAHKVYPGNMLDGTAFTDFIRTFSIEEGLIMGDKGFLSPEFLSKIIKEHPRMKYLFPLKRNDSRIADNGLYEYTGTFKDENDIVSYAKKDMKDGTYIYSFKSMIDDENERKGYLTKADKNQSYDFSQYNKRQVKFGTIAFISNQDMECQEIYRLYDQRWEIETFFNFYKNIACLNNVRVEGDYHIIGSEFINFISSIISVRVKKLFIEKELHKQYSYKQIMDYLEQLKKIHDMKNKKWHDTKTVKYIHEIGVKLGLIQDV